MSENFFQYNNRDFLRRVILDQKADFEKKDLGVEREALQSLIKFAKTPQVVVISGLRRVGKSTLLAQLSRVLGESESYYTNFEDERLIGFTANKFELLHSVFVELFGEKRIFLLDEIQMVPKWESFVRRLSEAGYKFYLTGSNASLLSQELGTKLTGRYIPLQLFPFSFKEYLTFQGVKPPETERLTTPEQNRLIQSLKSYLQEGGIPDALKYPEISFHQTLYNDILYRDIAARYKIGDVAALKELAFYLISNIGNLISLNKLKEQLKLGSVNTVKAYLEYLENGWLLFPVRAYDYSVKKQQIAPKKIFAVDTGLAASVGFSFSENFGRRMENLIFISLKRKFSEIYYFRTKKGFEVDFYLPKEKAIIQSAEEITSPQTKNREIQSTLAALQELNLKKADLLTLTQKETLRVQGKTIQIIPLYEWLLSF